MNESRKESKGKEGNGMGRKQPRSAPVSLVAHLVELKRIKNKKLASLPVPTFLGSEKTTAVPYVALVRLAP